jgi:hypothetical protein
LRKKRLEVEVAVAGLAVEGGEAAGECGEEGAVVLEVLAAVGGGEEGGAEVGDPGIEVEAVGVEPGAVDKDGAEFWVVTFGEEFGGEARGLGEVGGGQFEVAGGEAVAEGVPGDALLAFGRAGAGGFEGVGAIGGEAAFGDGHG